MAIVGYRYDPEGIDAVYFKVTDAYPKEARRIRWLLLIAMGLSLVSAFQSMTLSTSLFRGSQTLEERVDALADDPALRPTLQAALERQRAEEGAEEPLSPEELEETLQRGQDAVSMVANFTGWLLIGSLALLCYFPIKYLLLWWGVGRGHPLSLAQIRSTAKGQVIFELARQYLTFDMNNQAELLHLPQPSAWTLLVATLILLYARTARIREYFSVYEVRPAPADMELPPGPARGGLTSERLARAEPLE